MGLERCFPRPAAGMEREVPAGHTRSSRFSARFPGDFPGKLRCAAPRDPHPSGVPSSGTPKPAGPIPAPPSQWGRVPRHPQLPRFHPCTPIPPVPSPGSGADPGNPPLCVFGGAPQGPGREKGGILLARIPSKQPPALISRVWESCQSLGSVSSWGKLRGKAKQ